MKNFIRYQLGRMLANLLRWRSQPYPFPAGVALVLAPHADDETLGCGGVIAAKVQRGDSVQIVFVTDSAGAPEGHHSRALAGQRRAEALAALAVLGVLPAHVHFLAAPDGRLNRLSRADLARLMANLTQLFVDLKPAEIFMPYRGGGSTEHDATTELARATITRAGLQPTVWEYPIWAWWNPRRLQRQLTHPQENFHLDLGAERAIKRAALACHVSQIVALPPTLQPALPTVLADLCTGPVEFYFLRQT